MQGFRRSLLLAASLLALAPLAPLAHAQGFPTKPIKIVITYTPGGTADVIARTLATSMSELLGQPVVVENKTGASGSIGTMAVKQAPPDGHTLLVTTIGTVVLAPMVTKDASFDPVKGLTPIANLAMAPIVLLVHQSVPANDFPGFVTWAKQQAKGVDIAVAGPTPEVATALLAQQAKLNLVNVPFRGSGPALQSVLAGDTKVIFQAPSVQMMEFIKQGKMKAVAVLTPQRQRLLPDTPSTTESKALKSFTAEIGADALIIGTDWDEFKSPDFEQIRDLRAEGRVMLISTHNLGSVPDFCDRAVLIDGRVTPAAVLWASVPTFWVRKCTRRLFTRRSDRTEVPSATTLWVVLKSSP